MPVIGISAAQNIKSFLITSQFVSKSGSYRGVGWSTDGITWSTTNSGGFANAGNYSKIASGGGKYIILRSGTNQVYYSSNARTWTLGTLPYSSAWQSATYGGGRFVALGNYGSSAISTDGATWTAGGGLSNQSYDYNKDITYHTTAGKFVATWARNSNIDTSTDGVTWASVSTSMTNSLTDTLTTAATYGEGKVVIVGNLNLQSTYDQYIGSDSHTNFYTTSTDLITWTGSSVSVVNNPSFGTYTSVYGGGKYVALSYGAANYSTDLVTWTTASTSNYTWVSSAYGNGTYVGIAVDSDNKAVTSTNASSWTLRTLPSTRYWSGIAYGNSTFVLVSSATSSGARSNVAATSTDGVTWVSRTLPASKYWISCGFGGGKFVALAQEGYAAYSTNGVTWTATTLPNTENYFNVSYGNGVFAAVATNGSSDAATIYSTDGITWTNTGYTVPWSCQGLAFGNGIFLSMPDRQLTSYLTYAQAATSTDGIAWNPATPFKYQSGGGWRHVTYGTQGFAAFSETSQGFVTTTNGTTWGGTSLSVSSYLPLISSGSNIPSDITYGGGKFLAVSSYNTDTVVSTNGTTWTAGGAASNSITAVTYGGGKFVAVTQSAGIAYSTDAITWSTSSTGLISPNDIIYG